MGHLFTAGGRTVEGDGVRELYVGSLAHVASAIFPECIDYLALGHLHVPQAVNGAENRRYSGSPLPMGFGEAGQEKSVIIVEFSGDQQQPQAKLSLHRVPVFQRLERIQGGLGTITARLHDLINENSPVWLEIVYDGEELIADLREQLEEVVRGSGIEILRIKNNRIMERVLNRLHIDESLDDLEDGDVFLRCLDAHDVPADQRPELLLTYRQAVMALSEDASEADGQVAATAGPTSPGQGSGSGLTS
jgi:exonuclease SbcD